MVLTRLFEVLLNPKFHYSSKSLGPDGVYNFQRQAKQTIFGIDMAVCIAINFNIVVTGELVAGSGVPPVSSAGSH